jgi:hypothetical protein
MEKKEETNRIKSWSGTRRTRRASACAAGAPALRERHPYSKFILFNIRSSTLSVRCSTFIFSNGGKYASEVID